jgi:aromatic-L-amino-acid decarboxylase
MNDYSAYADYLADIINRFSGEYSCSPQAVQIENQMIKWVASIIGYDATTAGGATLSGGSMSGLMALITARSHYNITSKQVSSCCVYVTHHTHHSIIKALHLVGMGDAQIRYVDVDDMYAMNVDHLQQLITADLVAGLRPWFIVASAGTTNTGAIDPLRRIGVIAQTAGCWYHVDGAYGAFFILTSQAARLFDGIQLADSVVLDPHKGLFLPYGILTSFPHTLY